MHYATLFIEKLKTNQAQLATLICGNLCNFNQSPLSNRKWIFFSTNKQRAKF